MEVALIPWVLTLHFKLFTNPFMDQLSFIDDHVYVGTIAAATNEVRSKAYIHE